MRISDAFHEKTPYNRDMVVLVRISKIRRNKNAGQEYHKIHIFSIL